MTSIVVPAHDEATVIVRCLETMLSTALPDEFEVIVAANGCHDGTEELAAAYGPPVRVVSIPESSKIRALNAGDAHASSHPRLYVDADIEVSTEALRAVARALDTDEAVVAAPRISFDLDGRSWPVRAYYRTWMRLPWIAANCVGSGFYGLSRGARALFDEFPEVIADDLFVSGLVEPEARITIPDQQFVVHPPLDVRSLVRARTRIYAGNLQAEVASAADRYRGGHRRALLGQLRDLRRVPDTLVYISLTMVAKARARRARRAGDVVWAGDRTARTAAHDRMHKPTSEPRETS